MEATKTGQLTYQPAFPDANLPNEMENHILSFLPTENQTSYKLTSRTWNAILNDQVPQEDAIAIQNIKFLFKNKTCNREVEYETGLSQTYFSRFSLNVETGDIARIVGPTSENEASVIVIVYQLENQSSFSWSKEIDKDAFKFSSPLSLDVDNTANRVAKKMLDYLNKAAELGWNELMKHDTLKLNYMLSAKTWQEYMKSTPVSSVVEMTHEEHLALITARKNLVGKINTLKAQGTVQGGRSSRISFF